MSCEPLVEVDGDRSSSLEEKADRLARYLDGASEAFKGIVKLPEVGMSGG